LSTCRRVGVKDVIKRASSQLRTSFLRFLRFQEYLSDDAAPNPQVLATFLTYSCSRRAINHGTSIFAQFGLEEQVDIHVVQRLLGHSNIATTTRYLHLSDTDLADAVDRAFPLVED